jgi:hypothetical protein
MSLQQSQGVVCKEMKNLIDYAIVDAFTDEAFKGNPAAVCYLLAPKEARWMQQVAAEFNLSQTAFLVRRSAHGGGEGGEGGEEPLLQDEENAAEKNENNHDMKSAAALNCTANLTLSSSPNNKEVDQLHHAACKYKSCTKKICVITITVYITSQGNPPIQEFLLVNSSYVRV